LEERREPPLPPMNSWEKIVPRIPRKKLFETKFRSKGAANTQRIPYLTRGLEEGLVKLSRKQKRNLNKKWANNLIEKAEREFGIDIDKKVIFAKPDQKLFLKTS